MKLRPILLTGAFCLLCAFCVFAAEGPPASSKNFVQIPDNMSSSSSQGTGLEKISLDVRGMDIVEVLKIFASHYGMNISVGKNVTGRVTLFLKDVSVEDAFEILISSNELAYEKKSGIVYVMMRSDYEGLHGDSYQQKAVRTVLLKYAKAEDAARTVSQLKSSYGKIIPDTNANLVILIDDPVKTAKMEEVLRQIDLPVATKLFTLYYAQADKIGAKMQEEVTKGVGSVRIDERTNQIAVTDYLSKMPAIEKLIQSFDKQPPQVLIDAQIIQITPSDKFEAGVDWESFFSRYLRIQSTLPTPGAVNKIFLGVAAGNSAATPTSPGEYKTIIDLLRTIGDTKILSSPRVTVLNNQEAKILVGTRQPYAQQTTVTGDGGTVTTAETINFIDVGIKLYVTPTINDDGFVTMKIKPEVSSAAESLTTAKGEKVPIVSTAETETSVRVKDGVTLIIGGLKKDESIKTERRIPFIGDLPLIGNGFKNQSNQQDTSDLVIFLTPHVLMPERSVTDMEALKPKDGVRIQLKKEQFVTERYSAATGLTDKNPDEDAKSRYYAFLTARIKSIPSSWSVNKKGTAKILFTLNRLGEVQGEPQSILSSDFEIAENAVRRVKQASPFDPFPDKMKNDTENFVVTLDYE